ncbi:hypothetical protein EOA60_34165 [Mesorhizobium sp. M1A.F.Ca.IN.020.06.1.1]|nr:hypothetical protein CK214_11825 [Mesorhizobium sp. WSM3882]RUV05733.1 hypothetical protein EOA79_11650 [Mesorhizobium sp. M1A.F.Ca.IN.020.03.2.1]RUV88482.1 hypothetical protein EOA51_07190 [Mesorhizobium sp. M1A.F.Ca.IN.020.32.1.1]RUW09307.1 hypothetical protein EOA46_18430 [Mesorhizobium sp. M1A.F.Ca.IN.022.05.2.1]RUW13099.1 hypothetical protein EOA60_34165 [Mesorhizobium sp. M1A.F.Ca.IN.020.06.1.1]RWF80929.1 MAG: hypothetical protein EOQ35_15810 [Mesorhizobium sp.]
MFAPEHPPLACRPSPPQGGRSAVASAFANRQRKRSGAAPKLPISPLAGEMRGSAEGGGTECGLARKPAR